MKTVAMSAIIRPRPVSLLVGKADAFAAPGIAIFRLPVLLDDFLVDVALVTDRRFIAGNVAAIATNIPFMPANIARLVTLNVLPADITALMLHAAAVAMRALLRVTARTLLSVPASSAIALRTRMSAAVSATAALCGMAAALLIVVRM